MRYDRRARRLIAVLIAGLMLAGLAGLPGTQAAPNRQDDPPYQIPDNPPGVDESLVITEVYDRAITLADFQQRVRFERWYVLNQLVQQIEKHGTEKVLDLTNPDNAWVLSLFVTLADSQSLGTQVQRIMIIEEIALHEAAERGMEPDPYLYDAKLAQFLGMTLGAGGALPPEFADAYPGFLDQMARYTGMDEQDLFDIVRARTLYTQLEFEIGQSPEAIPLDAAPTLGIQIQDIVLTSEDEANDVVAGLQSGMSLLDIATALGFTPTGDETMRVVRPNDRSLTEAMRDAIFDAEPGDIVGPIEFEQGWWVAVVGNEVMGALTPTDIEEMRKQFFLTWIENQMDDETIVIDYANWLEYVPEDPLPKDVSPYLVDENVIFPEDGAPAE